MKNLKKALEELAKPQPGPAPTFTPTQLLELILYLGEKGVVGRKRLSTGLGVGEGAVRNMLSRLKRAGLVEADKSGCSLTREGRCLYVRLAKTLINFGSPGFQLPWEHLYNHVVIVRGKASSVRRGLEQRDAAIRAGADAVMVITYQDGRLLMPGVSNLSEERPEFASQLLESINLRNGDVVIIAGARSPRAARHGAVAAAQTLL